MSHRYRMYPSVEQEQIMAMHCNHARFVWNLALSQCEMSQSFGRFADQHDWSRQLTEARGSFDWLAEGSSQVQHEACRDLQQAFRNWWGNPAHFGRPTFRSRHRGNSGFSVQGLGLKTLSNKWASVKVPKAGWVKFRLSMPWGDHKSARVTLNRSGQWHISLVGMQPALERTVTGLSVGVDRGITDAVVTSDEFFTSPYTLSHDESRRKKHLQRKLAKQRKGSNRRAKTKTAIAKLSLREANRRKDWVEKTSTRLVREYDLIVFEDLKVSNMMRSASGTVDAPGKNVAQKRGLNRGIAAQGWTMLKTRTEQKVTASEGCEVKSVPPAFTSQRCSLCGEIGDRKAKVFTCGPCDLIIDADVNAARNIRDLGAGVALAGRGGPGAIRPTCETSTPALVIRS